MPFDALLSPNLIQCSPYAPQGAAHKPYHWSPSIVDIQIFRVGQLVMLILPSEFTTMSGRRLRETMRAKLIEDGIIGEDAYVVAVGPANTYAHVSVGYAASVESC